MRPGPPAPAPILVHWCRLAELAAGRTERSCSAPKKRAKELQLQPRHGLTALLAAAPARTLTRSWTPSPMGLERSGEQELPGLTRPHGTAKPPEDTCHLLCHLLQERGEWLCAKIEPVFLE